MKEHVLKIIAVIGALFIGYLWSGGIWDYRLEKATMRINKLTGSVQVIDYDREEQRYLWRDISERIPITEHEVIPEEEAAAPVE